MLGSINLAIHGPTENSQILLNASMPAARLTGSAAVLDGAAP